MLLLVFRRNAHAYTYDDFTYELINGDTEVQITDLPTDSTGDLVIPVEIDGMPVTSIEGSTFSGCAGLISVVLPEGVTGIGSHAFSHCSSLTRVVIPSRVTTIGDYAFSFCAGLTSVVIPKGVTSIGDNAFWQCTGLRSAYFPGNAPGTFGTSVFSNTGPGFTIYYYSTATGYTSPGWKGYSTVVVSAVDPGIEIWRKFNSIPTSALMIDDLNGDGVSLLMAYAVNLDPHENLARSLPSGILLGENALELDFFAGRSDVRYSVEMSTNLSFWTTNGVTLSPLGTDNHRTATVTNSEGAVFMRLSVEELEVNQFVSPAG